jgi:nitrate/nitrite transport system substrate-binding protein
MRRWGQITDHKADDWYLEVAKQVYRPDIYLEAARLVVEDGNAAEADFPWDSDGFRAPQSEFIDGITFDGRQPNAYLEKFPIGLKGTQKVAQNTVVGG